MKYCQKIKPKWVLKPKANIFTSGRLNQAYSQRMMSVTYTTKGKFDRTKKRDCFLI